MGAPMPLCPRSVELQLRANIKVMLDKTFAYKSINNERTNETKRKQVTQDTDGLPPSDKQRIR